MTQSEKLQALIQKAIESGYNDLISDNYLGIYLDDDEEYIKVQGKYQSYDLPVNQLIFNHDFMRALIGNGPNCAYCGVPPHNMHPSPCVEGNNIWPYLWEYHIQKAVISPDPIGYLYKAVFKGEANESSI